MTPDNFRLIAQTARELRTEAATYTLLDAYARNGCATYPVDSALFAELWPDGQVPGFVLSPNHATPATSGTHTVAYAEIEPRTTHTPGPWACKNGVVCIDERSEYWRPRLEYANRGMGIEGWRIATVEMGFSEEDAANARLIAAAPDLLGAAQHALEDLEHLKAGKCDIDHITGVLIELRTAINKAGGAA